jgi:polyhydroxyalkanoate synthase
MTDQSTRESSPSHMATPFGEVPLSIFGLNGPFADFMRSANPMNMLEQNIKLFQNMFEIATGTSTIAPDPRDWRFQDETWTKNPLYHRLSQAYLAMTAAVEQMIPDDLEADDKARAELAASIVTSAFAPTNTLLGNPAAIQRTIETRGANLSDGFKNMLDDWINNGGMPSQVDDSGYTVGENLAVTPGKVVHRTEMFELIQYAPATEKVHEIPVLLIPPQIGRYYFTDLAPRRSFAEYTVSQGLQHFVVSWRNPQAEHREWGLEDYTAAALEATQVVCEIAGKPKLNLVAFCAGGMLATIVAGHLAAKGSDRINTLALCVTMSNFQTNASIGAFRLPAMLTVAKAQSESKGMLPGDDLSKVFAWLRPNDLVWNYWVNNYLMGETPSAFDILAWNKDNTNLPAKLHSDFLKLFEENQLIEPGGYVALGEPVDMGKITCDNFIVGAVTDHITPWKACFQSTGFLGGDSTFALSNGGHVAALVNPPGNPKAYHYIGKAQSGDDPDAWLAANPKISGSWWESWAKWCGERSGKSVAAPKQLGSKAHPPLQDAPGRYVHE